MGGTVDSQFKVAGKKKGGGGVTALNTLNSINCRYVLAVGCYPAYTCIHLPHSNLIKKNSAKYKSTSPCNKFYMNQPLAINCLN